jgi:hypothetical protein
MEVKILQIQESYHSAGEALRFAIHIEQLEGKENVRSRPGRFWPDTNDAKTAGQPISIAFYRSGFASRAVPGLGHHGNNHDPGALSTTTKTIKSIEGG